MTAPNHNHLNLCNRRNLWFKSSASSDTSVAKKTVKISVQNSSLLRLTSDFQLLTSSSVYRFTQCQRPTEALPATNDRGVSPHRQVPAPRKTGECLPKILVRPTNSENFPLSLFVKNMQKSSKIVKSQNPKVDQKLSKPYQKLSKVTQKRSISCQNPSTF